MTSAAAAAPIARPTQIAWVLAAMACGLALALIDTSPNWDDAGISAGVLVILCVIFGALAPLPAWASALAVAIWIPVLNIYKAGNAESLMVLPIALVAAYAARAARNLIVR